MGKQTLSRREFLRFIALTSAGAALASCATPALANYRTSSNVGIRESDIGATNNVGKDRAESHGQLGFRRQRESPTTLFHVRRLYGRLPRHRD